MKTRFNLAAGTRATIKKPNFREEHHGDEVVRAVDIPIEVKTTNDALGLLHPKLKAAMYEKARTGTARDGEQTELDLPVSDLPALRFPDLGTLTWKPKLESYRLVIASEVSGPIELRECRIASISAELIDGGSIILRFQVQKTNYDREQAGAITDIFGTTVEIELEYEAREDVRQGSTLAEVVPLNARAAAIDSGDMA